MYSGIPYGMFHDLPECRVSIDNVRLKFQYRHTIYDFEKGSACLAIDMYCAKLDVQFFKNLDVVWRYCDYFKIGNYARTCVISGIDPFVGKWSCAVMIGRYTFDTSCKLIVPEIVFDFNPNKVPDDISTCIINLLRDGALHISVIRYDVAFDFPIPRDSVTLIRNDKQDYKLFRNSTKGVTEYQGQRSKHGSLKLYDKMKESGLSVPVTRCEITVDGNYIESLEKLFPSLIVLDGIQIDTGFHELPFQVVSCLLYPDLMPLLKSRVDYKTWKKYRDMITAYGNCRLVPKKWDEINRYVRTRLNMFTG